MRVLNEEQKKWVEVIGEFAKKVIEPIMLEWDKVVDPSKATPSRLMRRHSSWA